MRGTIQWTMVLSLLVTMASLAPAQAPAQPNGDAAKSVDLQEAMRGVRFAGAVPPLQALEGKSTVVLVYATWCPKCNEWSDELFAQVRAAAVESPVVVFAINADESERGPQYAIGRGLVGPNIVHGDDPSIVQRLGLNSELFKFAVFNPEGKMVEKGEGGSFFPKGNQKDFLIANKMREGKIPGEFAILSKAMAPVVKQALWPVEMGQPVTDKALMQLRSKLPEENRDQFNTAISDYLKKHLEMCQQGVEGEVPQQIKAYELADALATRFGSTPQGREAKEIVAKFDDDTQFKKEVSAAKSYQRALQATDPSAARRSLIKVARRFEGTYYGDLAAKNSQVEQ